MPTQMEDNWHDCDDEGDGPYVCENCQGEGVEMSCCDDLCHGQGYCMFNPPRKGCYKTCSECKGTGEVT